MSSTALLEYDFSAVDAMLVETDQLLSVQSERKRTLNDLTDRVASNKVLIDSLQKEVDLLIRSSTLIGSTSDQVISDTLKVIEGVINRALGVIFREDPRRIKIEHIMYREEFPHFVVTLYTGHNMKKRKFSQSGRGLAQMISFLFTVTLIDTRKGRPILIMDEILSGVHPQAKKLVRDLILAVSQNFQFVMVEYSFDIGKQYEVKRTGATSTVSHYKSGKYYYDLMMELGGNPKALAKANGVSDSDDEDEDEDSEHVG